MECQGARARRLCTFLCMTQKAALMKLQHTPSTHRTHPLTSKTMWVSHQAMHASLDCTSLIWQIQQAEIAVLRTILIELVLIYQHQLDLHLKICSAMKHRWGPVTYCLSHFAHTSPFSTIQICCNLIEYRMSRRRIHVREDSVEQQDGTLHTEHSSLARICRKRRPVERTKLVLSRIDRFQISKLMATYQQWDMHEDRDLCACHTVCFLVASWRYIWLLENAHMFSVLSYEICISIMLREQRQQSRILNGIAK